VGVNHIVEDGPGDAASVQTRCGHGQMGVLGREKIEAECGETEEGAPGERQAEDELRVVGDALGERVGGDEGEGGDGVGETCRGELEEDDEAGKQLGAGEEQGVGGRYGAAGERAEAGARDVRVEVAVPEVVDGAAGAAHDDGAG